MIPKKARGGQRAAGLLYYLWGPGKKDEHTDPHLVAAWDDRVVNSRTSLADMAKLLEAPVVALRSRRPEEHVYHVPVRISPGDRELSDEEWAITAREILDAAGIAPKDDDARSCRWIAMRHADDHIHIVATMATSEGRVPNVRQDMVHMQQRARELEVRFELRQLTSGDRTAAPWPTRAELEKAARKGHSEPPRTTLRAAVRKAAAGSTGETNFFDRLKTSGVRVTQRVAPDGAVTGYSVALPGDRTGQGRAVWYSGSRLAPDLSLPRVRERWSTPGAAPTSQGATPDRWRAAEARVRAAQRHLESAGNARAAGDVAALGDLLVVAAATAPDLVREELTRAASEFERASRVPNARALDGEARKLYQESTQTLHASVAQSSRTDVGMALGFLTAAAVAVAAAQRRSEAREERAQTESAAQAGRLLRRAAETVTGASVRTIRRSSVSSTRRPQPVEKVEKVEKVESSTQWESVVREYLPRPYDSDAVISDPAWSAVQSGLRRVASAGESPGEVLAQIAAARELVSADSVAEVLSWRLQGWLKQNTPVGSGARAPGPGSSSPRRVPAPPVPARHPMGDQQQPGRGRGI